jgi:hypothetical protein
MATARQDGSQSFESQFPIVATNLRALVSSWLPAARDPSPIDEETVDGEVDGRQERYRQTSVAELTSRLALGAKVSAPQPSTQFQNRMNRKLGISSINGFSKVDKTKGQNGTENGHGKRKAEINSDSEEDSKSKLVSKSSSKKHESNEQISKKKRVSTESAPHKAITTGEHSALSPIQSPKREKLQKLLSTDQSASTGSDPPPLPNSATAKESTLPATLERPVSPPIHSVLKKVPDLPKLAEFRQDTEDMKKTEGITEDEKKRLKREKKKERKRLKKLEKKNSQLEDET